MQPCNTTFLFCLSLFFSPFGGGGGGGGGGAVYGKLWLQAQNPNH